MKITQIFSHLFFNYSSDSSEINNKFSSCKIVNISSKKKVTSPAQNVRFGVFGQNGSSPKKTLNRQETTLMIFPNKDVKLEDNQLTKQGSNFSRDTNSSDMPTILEKPSLSHSHSSSSKLRNPFVKKIQFFPSLESLGR